ncbi:MAG: peptidylprolyl isomerase [Gammaproteobacteria bacterium]|jgi:cyclophilin family peptidyl-prolyl cis-trans isomerase|nr:peptidylprolyl isomerase [Gammaproteobacteria bacterium]
MLRFSTNLGDFDVELFQDKAPITVENFLSYVDEEFFDGTIFHRVIPGFMVQGGGFTADMDQKKTHAQIKNEADNGLGNERGTLAMARTSDINSATAQFFINLTDNTFLNHSSRDFGYAVFGKVTSGMDVVDKMAAQATGTKRGHSDVPLDDIVVKSVRRIED